jgi:hypothetical protein
MFHPLQCCEKYVMTHELKADLADIQANFSLPSQSVTKLENTTNLSSGTIKVTSFKIN